MVATGRTFLFRRSFSTRVLRLLLIIGIISLSNHGETFEPLDRKAYYYFKIIFPPVSIREARPSHYPNLGDKGKLRFLGILPPFSFLFFFYLATTTKPGNYDEP